MHTTWANDPVNSPNHYTRSHPGMECIDLNWNSRMNVSESIDWRHSTPGELDLHRFIGLTRRGQTLDGYLSCFMQNGWWTLTDADNLATVIKPDANGNPTLNTELFRSINVLKEIRP